MDELDLAPIEGYYEVERRGQPPYHPRLMVKLLVYGYAIGVRSSRKIAQRLDVTRRDFLPLNKSFFSD